MLREGHVQEVRCRLEPPHLLPGAKPLRSDRVHHLHLELQRGQVVTVVVRVAQEPEYPHPVRVDTGSPGLGSPSSTPREPPSRRVFSEEPR